MPLEKDFYDLQVHSLQGQKIAGLKEKSLSAEQIFVEIPATSTIPEQYFSPIFFLETDGRDPVTAIVTPLWNIYRQKRIGYLVCVIHLGTVLMDLARTYQGAIAETQMEKYLTLIDQKGVGLEIPWQLLKSIQTDFTTLNDLSSLQLISNVHGGLPERHIGKHLCKNGREMFGQSFPLSSTGWTTLIELSAADAMQPIQILEGKLLGLVLVVTLSTVVLLFFPIQYLIRPLNELQRMAFRIKEGDFSARNQIQTQDEIGHLAKTFNLMAEAVEERTRNLEKTAADLKKRERELREEHHRLNTVVSSMQDGLILLDNTGRIILSNKAAEPIMQVLLGKADGLRVRKCDAHLEVQRDCIACLLHHNQANSCVLDVADRIYEVNSAILSDEDGRAGKVLVARDITERILMSERQMHQEQLAVLGKTAAVVAHEMNSPLAAISMYNQMMEAELPPDSPFREHVEVIKRNTLACQQIIKDLLSYARIPQPKIEEIDLHDILDHVIRFLQPFHKEKRFDITKIFQAPQTRFLGDATQMQQVFVNLLLNAIQALPQKEGKIEISTTNEGEDLIVDIFDNGSGIDPKLQPNIFEPFFTTKKQAGTGLGLSIARRIAVAHGGDVVLVESRPGSTHFRVKIPLKFKNGQLEHDTLPTL